MVAAALVRSEVGSSSSVAVSSTFVMLSPDSRLRWLAPNLITAANISAGFLSMLAAAEGEFEGAVYLLILAVLLDLFDAKVARRLNVTPSRCGCRMRRCPRRPLAPV